MKLHVTAFAVTCGLLWGLGLFLGTLWIVVVGGATGEATLIGRVYLGYNISPLGAVIGLLWGLVDGFVGGAVFALLYNTLQAVFGRPAGA
jgi:hypothetical protein